MLGLSNALSASSTSEQLYGLSFDGSDYLDMGHTFQTTIQGDFSWSLWVKPNDGQPASDNVFVGTQNASSEDIFYFGIDTDGKIFIEHKADDDPATYTTDAAIFPDGVCDWTHIVVAADYTNGGAATTYKIFVNGIEASATLENSVSEDKHESFTIGDSGGTPEPTDNFYIGGQNNDGVFEDAFQGNLDEVAIWSVVLDADAVMAVYNSGKPFNLNNNKGNYDNSSALQGYWKMGNGTNDDFTNGFIFDQTAPTIGPNLVVNPSFEDVSGWGASSGSQTTPPGPNERTTEQVHSGTYAWKFQRNGIEQNRGVRSTDNITVETDTVYRVSWWSYCPSANNSTISYINRHAGNAWQGLVSGTGYSGSNIGGDTWVKQSVLFRTASSGTTIKLRFGNGASTGDDGDIIYFDDIELVKIGGNPGITSGNQMFSVDTPDDQAMSNVMMLDGVADYLEASGLAGSDFPETGSISFWVKGDFSSQGINAGDLFDKYDGSDLRNHIFIRDYTGSVLQIACQDDSPSYRATGTITVIDDQWNHVVVTWDTSALVKRLKGYVNGNTTPVVDVEIDVSGGWTPDGQVIKFGDGHEGLMDEIAIFNAVLNGNAVAAVYGAGRNYDLTADTGNYTNASDLEGYWRMGDGADDDVTNGIIHDQNNPGFADAANYLTASWASPTGGWSTTTGGIVNSGTNGNIRQVLEFSDYIGDVYKLEYTLSSVTDSTTLHAKFGGGSNQVITGTAGNHIHYLTNDATLDNFQFNSDGSWAGTITNISLRRLNGNPGITANEATMIRQPI